MVTVQPMIKSFANCYYRKRIFPILSLIVALIFPAMPALSQVLSLDELAGKIQRVYDHTVDFRAAFVQEATIKSMERTTREGGTVYLKKPERMLWDYTDPSMKKLVINPRKAWLYLPEEEIVYVQDAKNVLSSKMTIRFLTGIGRLKDDFDMAFSPDGPTDAEGDYVILLTPRGYEAGIKTLVLTVNKDTFHITGCVFTDLYDNDTRLTFSNIEFNTDPPDELFEFTPPPGVKIYNVQGQ